MECVIIESVVVFLITFRTFPGVLFSRVARTLGFKISTERFLNEEKAIKRMDEILLSGTPVGCVVGMYYLPYMPDRKSVV